MSLTIAQSDYFWADLQRQVDWYRDRAGSEIATNYVDAVEATLHQLARAPELVVHGSGTGRSSWGFILGACKSLITGT